MRSSKQKSKIIDNFESTTGLEKIIASDQCFEANEIFETILIRQLSKISTIGSPEYLFMKNLQAYSSFSPFSTWYTWDVAPKWKKQQHFPDPRLLDSNFSLEYWEKWLGHLL